MKKIPSQLLLITAVLSTVVVANLAPMFKITSKSVDAQIIDNSLYAAPYVPQSHNQGFIAVLKLDRRFIRMRPREIVGVETSIQSYNSIAPQIPISELKSNGLPAEITE